MAHDVTAVPKENKGSSPHAQGAFVVDPMSTCATSRKSQSQSGACGRGMNTAHVVELACPPAQRDDVAEEESPLPPPSVRLWRDKYRVIIFQTLAADVALVVLFLLLARYAPGLGRGGAIALAVVPRFLCFFTMGFNRLISVDEPISEADRSKNEPLVHFLTLLMAVVMFSGVPLLMGAEGVFRYDFHIDTLHDAIVADVGAHPDVELFAWQKTPALLVSQSWLQRTGGERLPDGEHSDVTYRWVTPVSGSNSLLWVGGKRAMLDQLAWHNVATRPSSELEGELRDVQPAQRASISDAASVLAESHSEASRHYWHHLAVNSGIVYALGVVLCCGALVLWPQLNPVSYVAVSAFVYVTTTYVAILACAFTHQANKNVAAGSGVGVGFGVLFLLCTLGCVFPGAYDRCEENGKMAVLSLCFTTGFVWMCAGLYVIGEGYAFYHFKLQTFHGVTPSSIRALYKHNAAFEFDASQPLSVDHTRSHTVNLWSNDEKAWVDLFVAPLVTGPNDTHIDLWVCGREVPFTGWAHVGQRPSPGDLNDYSWLVQEAMRVHGLLMPDRVFLLRNKDYEAKRAYYEGLFLPYYITAVCVVVILALNAGAVTTYVTCFHALR